VFFQGSSELVGGLIGLSETSMYVLRGGLVNGRYSIGYDDDCQDDSGKGNGQMKGEPDQVQAKPK